MDKFIGIDTVIEQLNRHNHDGFAVYTVRGNEEVFRRYRIGEETTEELNQALEDFLKDLEENNPGSFVGYKIQLYEYPEGAKKRKACGVIPFQLNETPNKEHFKTKQQMNNPGSEYVHKDTMIFAIENANLKNENMQLQARLQALEDRLNEEDEEEEQEEDENAYMGAIAESLKDKIPVIIDTFMGMILKPNQPAAGIAGVEHDTINEVLQEFKQINPNIENDLKKLLQLAKTKPDLFKMLISQLRMM